MHIVIDTRTSSQVGNYIGCYHAVRGSYHFDALLRVVAPAHEKHDDPDYCGGSPLVSTRDYQSDGPQIPDDFDWN
ncbi:hypothetical protein [Gimesia sp.]|uniref:hypothetical protein n=1 Tax=Gimesia sp. TaxID=2024833 RepID=UPI003A8D8012